MPVFPSNYPPVQQAAAEITTMPWNQNQDQQNSASSSLSSSPVVNTPSSSSLLASTSSAPASASTSRSVSASTLSGSLPGSLGTSSPRKNRPVTSITSVNGTTQHGTMPLDVTLEEVYVYISPQVAAARAAKRKEREVLEAQAANNKGDKHPLRGMYHPTNCICYAANRRGLIVDLVLTVCPSFSRAL